MIELIMNERVEAERIISDGDINTNTASKLFLLSKYYRHNGKGAAETRNVLLKFMEEKYSNYNIHNWFDIIQKYSNKAINHSLTEIDEIPITKNELTTISQINNSKLEKVAFVILVLAKFCNMRNAQNNNWVMVDEYGVFKRARVTGSIHAQYSCFYQLAKMDLITYSRKVDNINVKVGFIDNASEVVLTVTDLRELGYQYLMYKGEKFIKCAECGIITRATKHNKKYCKSCAAYKPIEKKMVVCCDCGKQFEVSSKASNTKRCECCQLKNNKEKTRERVKRYRNSRQCNDIK